MKSRLLFGIILSVMMVLLDGCQPIPFKGVGTPLQPTAATAVVYTLQPMPPTLEPVLATVTPSLRFDSTYTESEPLLDLERIFSTLESIRQLELRGVDEPGWYLHYHLPENDGNFSFLVHVIDDNRTCREQMVFTKNGDIISPYLFMNEAGAAGRVDYEGKVLPFNTDFPICDLENPRSMGMLGPYDYILSGKLAYYQNEIELMKKGQTTSGEFSAWFNHHDGKEVFIVRFHFMGMGIWKNSKEDYQTIQDQSSYDEFDLENGRLLRTWQIIILDNGEDIKMETKHYLTYYPELPADLQATFDQVVSKLNAFEK